MGDNPASFDVYERLLAGDDLPTLDEILGRPDWMKDAACREHPEVSFFPSTGEHTDPAKAVCRGCLVRAECLEMALSQWGPTTGVWGGLSERERKQLRRAA